MLGNVKIYIFNNLAHIYLFNIEPTINSVFLGTMETFTDSQ